MSLNDAVIAFDLDGTLVDTAPDLIGALNAVLEEEQLPAAPVEAARNLVGRGARTLLQRGFVLAERPWETEREKALVERFVEFYLARITQESQPFPGMLAALEALKAEGARFVVCTNKRTDLSIALLDGLQLTSRFEAVVGADLAPKPKPDGSHLLTALAAAGGRPERGLMVGDSEADIGAARAAGVPSVAVSFGYSDVAVETLGSDAVIHAYDELRQVAERLLDGR